MMYVKYYDNALPEDYCQRLINKFEKNINEQEDTIFEGHRSFKEINLNTNNWPEVNDLIDSMQLYLRQYMMDFRIDEKSWPKNLGYEQFRMKKYMPNDKDEFQFHTDVIDYATARRFLVYFWYLNDVDEGGETAFRPNRVDPIVGKVKPKTGRLLIFPPLWTHPHIGMKPISGPKYILGGYLHYV